MALGVQLANWPEMKLHRERVLRAKRIGVRINPSYGFGARGELVELKRKAGYASPSAVLPSDGPMLVLTRAYPYQTKGGIPKPITQLPLFTTTSKMGCLSYSLPAGPLWSIGTCQMSQRMTVQRELAARPHAELQLQFDAAPGRALRHRGEVVSEIPPRWVCDVCYAGKSHYRLYGDQAMKMAWRLAWTRAALKKRNDPEFFVREIVRGIENFRMLPKFSTGKKRATQESIGLNANYFRWHDAGDIFSPLYWDNMKEIARRLPKVLFWVPTRQWANQDWRDRFAADFDSGDLPRNLIVRPSALFTDAPAPQVYGLAAGTMVTSNPVGSLRVHRQEVGRPFEGGSEGIYDPDDPTARRLGRRVFPERRTVPVSTDEVWDCPAYLGDSDKTRSCIAQNCRVCWTKDEVEVGYDAH